MLTARSSPSGRPISSKSPFFRQQGLFDLREYLRHYAEGNEIASVAEIGVCIAEQVLGEEIFRHLWASESQRTLRIQLPGAAEEENLLAAALARVPWEIARPAANQQTLGERNLLVRVVHEMAASPTAPLTLGAKEDLRVLFVFAEARGSRPLAARKERRELLRLFEKDNCAVLFRRAHVAGAPRGRIVSRFRLSGVRQVFARGISVRPIHHRGRRSSEAATNIHHGFGRMRRIKTDF